MPNAIGGYFEMELPEGRSYFHDKALLYQSARAAFRALVKEIKPNRLLVPKFICDSMISSLDAENIKYIFYDLEESFNVPDSIILNNDDLLLYVNYYGVCQAQVDRLLERYPARQLVFDFSQAFFEPPKHQALATIYSPRKFFGLPDGGMLVTSAKMTPPKIQDSDSLARMSHLLKRLCEDPEAGYIDYIQAEISLKNSTPKSMSNLTRRFLRSINYNKARIKRTENFLYIHSCIKKINKLVIDTSKLNAPLCYPLATNIKNLRKHFINNRIYLPTYWKDASKRVNSEWNEKIIKGILPIPIDQRYNKKDLSRIISLVSDAKME
jgi:hypothetical protein